MKSHGVERLVAALHASIAPNPNDSAEGDECHDVPNNEHPRPLQMSLYPAPNRLVHAKDLSRSLLLLDVRLPDDIPTRPLGELNLESLEVVGVLE